MGVHVKGSVPLICIVRKRSCFVFEAFEISVFPVNRALATKSTETTELL